MKLPTKVARRGKSWRSVWLLVFCCVAASCNSDGGPAPLVLKDLRVDSAKTSLNPEFDPQVFRYSVIADEASDTLLVTPFADSALLVSVNGQLTSSGTATSIANMKEGDTVRIKVERKVAGSDDSTTYEILYLPPDFPSLSVSILEDEVNPDPLYVNLNGGNGSWVAIIDNHGVPMFYRREEQRVFDFKWHAATGERSYARATGTVNQWGRRDNEQVILDRDFNEIDRIVTVNLSQTDNHDFLIQPGNELFLLSYDGRIRDLTEFGLTAEELIEDSVVQIVDRVTRQVLFEWNSWDELPYSDQTWPEDRGEYVHVNSIFEDRDGNIIISARGTSQVLKVSRSSGEVLWKLGGKSNQFAFINDAFPYLCGQHTASRLPNGNLLVFDNGQNCWPVEPGRGDLTRVVEYRIDEEALEAELVWSYSRDDAYTTSQGSAQRMPNGNTLIGWGRGPGILATEVDREGRVLFEIAAFDGDVPLVSYRARRFPE